MKNKITFILFLLYLFWIQTLQAQTGNTLSGTVVDSMTQQGIELATIRLLRTDSTLAAGSRTQADGSFTIARIAAGKYVLHISYIGYKPYVQPIILKKPVHLSSIRLTPNDIILKTATVTAKIPEIQMKEDTTVFNAEAIRVQEGDALEELIKKLPGVEIDDNGTVTVNGKQVKQFLINGKDFFKGDIQTALKNLPSELVKNIKSYDKQSDYAEQTGIDDGEEETVMDLTLKKELNESWISNINAGYGSHDLYNTRLFVNRMTDYSRLSLYGNLQNPNGTSRNENAGFDFYVSNRKSRKKHEAGYLSLNGNMRINRNRNNQQSGSNSETFLTAGSQRSFNNRINRNTGQNLNANGHMRLEWYADTMTSLTVTPSFSYGKSESASRSRSATFNDDPYQLDGMDDPLDAIFNTTVNDSLQQITVNRNERASQQKGNNYSISTEMLLVRKLNTEGRNINFRGNIRYNQNRNHSFSRSTIHYYQPEAQQPLRYTDQYTTNPSKSWGYQLQIGYNEPIFEGGYLQFRYQYAYQYNDRDRSLYQLDSLDGWAEYAPELGELPPTEILQKALDYRNSQYATYNQYNHNINLSFRVTRKTIRFNIGVNMRPQTTRMDYAKDTLNTTVTRHLFKIAPTARFQYRFSRTHRIEIRYRGSSSEPSMTSLLDVTDDSDPLHITKGNPGLKPSWTNRLSMDYNLYAVEKQQGLNINGEYSQTSNSISTAVLYDETTGVRTTRPENINGNWNVWGKVGFNTPLDEQKKFRFYTTTDIRHQNSVGFIRTSGSQESEKNVNRTTSIGERIRTTYRNDWLEIELNGQINYRHSQNKLNPSANLDTYHFSYGTNIQARLPWHMTISTNLGMTSRRGYDTPSMNTDELIWNAQISQSFLKKNAATISLRFQDILNQRSNVSRSINAQRRSDSWNERIYSYCMLHFIYRLNIFNGQKTR